MNIIPPSPKGARSLQDCNNRINLWDGSVRSGKTIITILAFVNLVIEATSGSCWIFGKTERTIERNIIQPMQAMLGDAIRKTGDRMYIFGKRVWLQGGNDEKAQTKVRGATIKHCLVDEVTLLPESLFKMILSRMDSADSKMYGTTNTDHPLHWLKRDFIDRRQDLDMSYHHFTMDDNPSLDPKYVAALKVEYRGVWYDRFIQGLWVVASGRILSEFDAERHVIDKLPPGIQFHFADVSIDYGTVNPLHAGLWGFGNDGKIYLLDSYRWDSKQTQRQKTDQQYVQDIKRMIQTDWARKFGTIANPRHIWVDPSAASFSLELWKEGLRQTKNADNDVDNGNRFFNSLFSVDAIRILRGPEGSGNRAAIEEFSGYAIDEKAFELRGEEKPVKLADHAPDMGRYFAKSNQEELSRLLHLVA